MDRKPGASILLVDDDGKSLDILTDLLEFEGYRVFTATNGRAALDVLEQNDMDLVITDFEMPVMDGFELLQSVSRGYPELPVIMLTGKNRENVQKAISAMKEGAYDYLLKPVDLTELRKSVLTTLNISQGKKESRALNEVLTTTLAELNRKNEKFEELSRIHNELLTILSQDLEAPFTILTGCCRMLRKELAPGMSEEHQEMIDLISRQEENIQATIRDLLDLAVVDTDRIVIHKVEARLHELVEKCAGNLYPVAINKGISFSLRLPPDLRTVYMDVGRMKQVLFNLMHQAISLSSNDTTIAVAIVPERRHQKVEILFHGNQIPLDGIKRLLSGEDRFKDMEKRMRYRLSLCREIVELHDGSIWAEEGGPGETAFCIQIPNLFMGVEAG
jgi:DNA-binding response OmpR family regulator